MSSPSSRDSSASDLKLPNVRSRRRFNKSSNEWVDADAAQRRRPIAALVVVATILLTGISLIVAGFVD